MGRWLRKIDEAALTGVSELEMFTDNHLREEAVRKLQKFQESTWRSPRKWLGAVFGAMLGIGFVTMSDRWLSRLPLFQQLAVGWAVFLPLSLLLRYVTVLVSRQEARLFLRGQLLASEVPICLACGYDLRGTVSQRCSECGRELDARVREILAGQPDPEASLNCPTPSATPR